jgi:hypothetical protein
MRAACLVWANSCGTENMRLPFTILITLLATLSYGQSLDGLRSRLKILEEPSGFRNDTTGFSSLPKIDYSCDNQNKIPSDNYHVVDLNGDGLKDLIYSGPCKNVTQSAIFLNTGRVFRKAYDNIGRVVSVEKVESETKINIIKEASRCDFFSQYTEVVINEKSQIRRNTIVFGAQTKISVAARLREDKAMGTMRTTPQVNDIIKRDACNNTIKGNHLTRIHDFRNIVQINKAGPWWLVMYPESGDRAWIGWMKLE